MRSLILLLLLTPEALAQQTGTATIALFSGTPTGTCGSTNRTLALDTATGDLYTCRNGGWGPAATRAAGPTVPPGATGNTGPAGSAATVAVGTTTTLAPGANAEVINTGTSSAAVFNFAIPRGDPGTGGRGNGSGLQGCETAESGRLVCDNSIAVGQGSQGVLSLGYSALPNAPSTAMAQLTADNQGQPFWSPGNNTAFAKFALLDPATGMLPPSVIDVSSMNFLAPSSFTDCNTMGWNASGGSQQSGGQSCADLFPNVQNETQYTIVQSDNNRVVQNTAQGQVINFLPPPANALAAPFDFWIESMCNSSVVLRANTGALINGQQIQSFGACGWAHIWASRDGTNWNAQIFSPPGGVTEVE